MEDGIYRNIISQQNFPLDSKRDLIPFVAQLSCWSDQLKTNLVSTNQYVLFEQDII